VGHRRRECSPSEQCFATTGGFIAYTRDLAIPERMPARMLGASGDGLHDRLMDFTRAVSGATFFAPSEAVLRKIAASR
jgi:deferrochelatase/peroxidase EfeB